MPILIFDEPTRGIGVDVGTGSACAGVFNETGMLLMSAKQDIPMHRAPGGIAEQPSAQVWDAVCHAVRRAVADAGICGLGYGLRQIIEAQASHGAPVTSIAISGGAGQHPLIRQVLADATGLPVEATICAEPVLLGSAILGAVAARKFEGLKAAMPIVPRIAQVFEPSGTAIARIHDQRFDALQKLQTAARDIRRAANGSAQ